MTQHYSVAQIVELHGSLEKIKDSAGRWNKSLATLKAEQAERQALELLGGGVQMSREKSPPKVPQIGRQTRVA